MRQDSKLMTENPPKPPPLQPPRPLQQWRIRQIITWSAFAFLYAAPCFILARLAGFTSYAASSAMVLGVVTWIAGLCAITSTAKWRNWEAGTNFGLGLGLGRCLRGSLAVLSGVGIFAGGQVPTASLAWATLPDMWSGLMSMRITIGPNFDVQNGGGFFVAYLTTLLTGFGVLLTLTIKTAISYGLVMAWKGIFGSRKSK